MSFYDISKRITNELPQLKITEDIICTVNNRTQTIINVQAMMQEVEMEKNGKEKDDFASMQKALEMLVGEKKAKEIEELNLPIPEFILVFRSVMAVAQGKTLEEMEAESVTP